MWPSNPGSSRKPAVVRMTDIMKHHTGISCVAYSSKYRVSLSNVSHDACLVVLGDHLRLPVYFPE